ncbi:MAG TPA: leucine-rich repeat protein [Verrucomicrobiae bacterium]|nr:leucine-rich repeat protein [Verrucomicrobiae bacterium]
MSDDDKTIRADDTVPSMSSGTHDQGGALLTTGMMVPPQMPGILGTIGKYQVVRVLGEGGMGQVLLARDPVTDSPVAIKIIRPEYLKKDWAVHRFLNEARHMFKLAHPSIIRVLEVSDREEGPYFVMPFIAGGSLAQKIKPGESLPAEEILCVARQVAEALHYAHARGIIHRDLKPSNILLDGEGRACLCDFGLLRTVFNDSIVDVTRPQMEGTVPYMSPAVAAGRAEDTRCDIYGFGCLLYEMLTGQPPYQGPTVDNVLKQIQAGPPRPIRRVNPSASAPLAAIAESAMARELRDRYAAVSDVIADLERVANGKAPLGPHGRAHSLRPIAKLAAAIGALALLVLAAVGVIHFRNQSRPGSSAHSANARGLPILPGLVAWWPGDGNAEDAIGHRKGQSVNGADFAPGFAGQAFRVNGTQYFRVPHDPALSFTNGEPITLEAWVYRTDSRLPFHVMGKRPDPENGMSTYQMGYDSSTVEVPTNRWAHLVIACSNDVVSEYLDGTLRLMERRGRQPFGPNDADILIGAANAKCMGFEGLIQHVRIYDRILSPDEVRSLHEAGRSLVRTSDTAPAIQASTPAQLQVPFTYTTNNGAITITKYIGSGGDVVIPSTINGMPVTGIGNNAFWECTNATSVTVPASVTSLESNPFDTDWSKGSRLLSIVVDAANPAYCSTPDGVVLNKEKTCLLSYPGAKAGGYVIPKAVTSIANAAFMGCYALTSVSIPNSVTNIGDWTFGHCTNLTRIAIPAGVISIGPNPFRGCCNLTSVVVDAANPAYCSSSDGVLFDKEKTCLVSYSACNAASYLIPNTVRRIGVAAFAECTKLTGITIPNSITSIGDWAFTVCTNLRSVTIPNSVTSISVGAFCDCSGITNVTIPDSVTSIGWSGFYGCSSLITMKIPSGITTISWQTFVGCSNLTSLTIPNSITSIEGNAFLGCSGLTSVYFKGNAPGGGSDRSVFGGAGKATVYYLPGTTGWGKDFGGRPTATWSLAEGPFEYSIRNGSVTVNKYTGPGGVVAIPGNIGGMPVTVIGCAAFMGRGDMTGVSIPDGVTCIEHAAFFGCGGLSSITIPESVTSIEGEAFCGCRLLTKVGLSKNVTKTSGQAFSARDGKMTAIAVDPGNPVFSDDGNGVLFDKKRKSIIRYPNGKGGHYAIPSSVANIGDWAFCDCTRLTSITVPNGVTNIGLWAFGGCASLTYAKIPASVHSIAPTAPPFGDCEQLRFIAVDPENKSYCNSEDGVLFDKERTCLINYPCGLSGEYVIPEGVMTIRWGAFFGCSNLSRVTIPESVTTIETIAFMKCANLTSIEFKGNVPKVGEDVFTGSNRVKIFYRPGTRGWGGEFGGRPTAPWNSFQPPAPPAPASSTQTRILPKRRYYPPGAAPAAGGKTNSASAAPSPAPASGSSIPLPSPALRAPLITELKEALEQSSDPETRDRLRAMIAAIENPTAPDAGANKAVPAAASSVIPFTYTTINGAITITKYTGPGGDVAIPSAINGLPVTAIGDNAFLDCSALTGVTIPDGVSGIGAFAFQGCARLSGITIPNSVTGIGYWGFLGCGGLTNVSIPASVTFLGPNPFWGTRVASFVVDRDNPAFSSGPGGVIFDKKKTRLVSYPGAKDGGYVIPDGVTSIADSAFGGCGGLTSITVPESVTDIGPQAFHSCGKLAELSIPNSVTNIGIWAFCFCGGLTNITIPSSVASMTGPFPGCNRLESVTVDPSNPAYSSSADGVVFDKDKTSLVSYPAGRAGSYVIPDGVRRVRHSAFRLCPHLTSLTVPASVTAIDTEAFLDCFALTGVWFEGNAPSGGSDKRIFAMSTNATVYYRQGTTGWGPVFGGRPTASWDPSAQTNAARGAGPK